MTQEELKNSVFDFLKDYPEMNKTRFGKLVLNDGNFVADLERGEREPRRITRQKVKGWIMGFRAAREDSVRA